MSFEFMMWENNSNADENINAATDIYCAGWIWLGFLLLKWETPRICKSMVADTNIQTASKKTTAHHTTCPARNTKLTKCAEKREGKTKKKEKANATS